MVAPVTVVAVAGAAGFAGSTGFAGATGAAGLAGSAGLAGAAGAAGAAGFAGSAGVFDATDLKGLIGADDEGLKSSSRNSANAFSAFFDDCAGDVKRFVMEADG